MMTGHGDAEDAGAPAGDLGAEVPEADALEQARPRMDESEEGPPRDDVPDADAQEQRRPGSGDAEERAPRDDVPDADAQEQRRAR